VDAGSNQVSVQQILPGGSLRLSDVVSSGGVLPVSIVVHGSLVGTSQIDSFTVGFDGGLTAAPGSPFTAQGLGPFGSQFRPTNPSQLFVTNAHNGTGLDTVSAFADSPNGSLTSIGASPHADQQTAPCWMVISPDGQYLFAVNAGSGTISRYAIGGGGQPRLLGSTNVSATAGVGAVDPGLSPGRQYLYVNESRIDSVGSFAVSNGNLTELPVS
jgi:6-phosphogluconolactonase